MQRRVLAIGIDGGTWDILGPLMAQGVMPNLDTLLKRSAHGTLKSTIPPITAAAWTSFATGKNPGKHGLVDFVHFPNHGYRVGIANSRTRASRAIWEIIGDKGKRVGVVAVPMTYPPEPVNGVMVTDLMTPNKSVEYTYPPELKTELIDKVGPFVITPGEGALPSQPLEYLDNVRRDVVQSANYALYLLKKERFDFFMYVFGVVDVLQHQFWNLLAAAPEQIQGDDVAIRGRLIGIFEQIDLLLGSFLELTDEDTLVLIMSDHGFGPIENFLHINNFLLERRYLVLKSGALSRVKSTLFHLGITPQNVHLALKSIKIDLRRKVNRGRSYGLLRRFFLSFDDVDWKKTRAFALGHIGQIYINMKGRQPQGIVKPGEDYENLRDDLRNDLLAQKHPVTGEHLFAQVLNREDVYEGDLLDQTPDLLLIPNNFQFVAFGESEFASNVFVGPTLGHTGHHRLEGILTIAGPNVITGAKLENPCLIDLAPTILHELGFAPSPDMDGRFLSEAFEPESRSVEPEYQIVAQTRSGTGSGYSDDEERQVLKRLGDLGYVS